MKFGRIPPEPPRIDALDQCAPEFAILVRDVVADMNDAGFDAVVYETIRTDEREEWLHGFGREYDDGRGIVTHATSALTSWHGYGLAADLISRSQEWNAPQSFWTLLGIVAIKRGLVWGGSWRMADLPHIQFGAPMRAAPSDRARELFAAGGMQAVWNEVGAA